MIYIKENFIDQDQMDRIEKIKTLYCVKDEFQNSKNNAQTMAAEGKFVSSFIKKQIYEDVKIDKTEEESFQKQMYSNIVNICFTLKNNNYIQSNITAGVFKVLSVNILQYDKGQKYDWHLDYARAHRHIPISNKISFTIFLSDDYNGGKLEIKFPGEIKKVKGKKVLLFSIHQIIYIE